MDKIKTYRDLDIWKKGIELVKRIYKLTENFPQYETYCLSSQLRRSAISIPSNVSEGFRRQYNKEFKQFLYIALGSCSELETQVIISHELKYIDKIVQGEILELLDHISRMIVNLNKKL